MKKPKQNNPFQPRKAYQRLPLWSEHEVSLLLNGIENHRLTVSELEKILPTRSRAAIRSKIRKLRISLDLFGGNYRNEKSEFTRKHSKRIYPEVVFDGYAGAGHQSLIWALHAKTVIAADKKKEKENQFLKNFLSHGYSVGEKENGWIPLTKETSKVFFVCGDIIDVAVKTKFLGFDVDLVDLDTCGSTLPLLPIILNLLSPKHLVITHGEFHSLRFGRDDVLRRILTHRDISSSTLNLSIDDLSIELDKSVKMSALRVHNETKDSFWAELEDEVWLGKKKNGMLRRIYSLKKSPITAHCLNSVLD